MKRALSLLLSVIMIFSVFSCVGVVTSAAKAVLEAVSFTPASELKSYEYTNGYWSISYDEETGGQVNKFYYNSVFDEYADGNVITLTYSNGESVEYVCEEWFFYDKDGNELDESTLSFSYNQEETQWTAGTNNIVMTYEGLTTEIPVEIMATPLESVEFVPAKPIELVEYADGEVFEHELGPDTGKDYFSYQYPSIVSQGNKFVLTYKTGETVTYTCNKNEFVNENGEELNLNYFSEYDVQDISPWTEPGSYAFPFYLMGCKSGIPVTVVESPVDSIQYVSAETYTLVENYDGWYEACECENCIDGAKEYFRYNLSYSGFPAVNDKLVVTYKDGSVTEFINDGEAFKDGDGKSLPYEFNCENFQKENHWEKGTEYFRLTYLGKSVMIPVQIIENPVLAIRILPSEPIEIYEATTGSWDYYYDENDNEVPYYYYENPIYSGNVSLVVDYTDGTSESYSYDAEREWLCTEDGKQLGDFTWVSDQYDNHWGLGEHAFTIEYMQRTCELRVNIVENPVKGIDFIPAEPLVFAYEVDGEWDEIYLGDDTEGYDAFLYNIEKYPLETDGNKLVVTYKTGKKDTFTYSSEAGDFVNKKGETLPADYRITRIDTQYDKLWTLESDLNTFRIECFGFTDDVRVVLDNGAAPEMAEITGCVNGNGKVTVNWKHVANATEYRVFRKDEAADGVSEWKELGTVTENSFVDKNIEKTGFYRYIVHAVNSSGRSEYNKKMVERTKYIAPLKTFKVYNSAAGIRINCGNTAGTNAIYRRAEGETKWTFMGNVPGTETYICDPNVKNGKTYQYYAVRLDGNYKSARVYSDVIEFVKAPKIKSVKNVYAGIKTTWSEVKGADSYRVYRRAAGESKWTLLGETKKLYYTDKSIAGKAGKKYTYIVKAVSGSYVSGYETGASLTRYSAPEIKSVANVKNGVKISWSKISKATEYKVYRRGTNDKKWVLISTTKKTSFTDTSVKSSSGKNYRYTVRAVYDGNLSPYNTNGVSVKRLSTPVLVGVANDQRKIKIKFNAVKGAEGYYIYRKTAKTNWVRVGTTTKTLYKDDTVKEGVTYIYTVKAYSGDYVSGYDTTGRKIKSVWEPAVNSLINAKKGVTITWHSQKVADEYHIYKRIDNGEWEILKIIKKADLKKNKNGEFTYTDKNVENNTVYSYTVRAYDDGYCSSYYKNRFITYYDPIDITSAKASKNGITVKWEKAKGADKYWVLRKEKGDDGFSIVAFVDADKTSYIDKNVDSGKTYEYAVWVVGGPTNKQGNSATGGTKLCTAK